ncbi:MAG: hypothetical protein ACRDTV_23820 [Mycobacterium sp.]
MKPRTTDQSITAISKNYRRSLNTQIMICDHTGRIIRDDHYLAHRWIRACVEHVIARLKDWQIPRQCRRRGYAINHHREIIAGLWHLKTRNQLRVTS